MSFIMPSRRSTTNLLQESGELWTEDAEEAPLQFVVLAAGGSTDLRIGALLVAATQLAPDDVALQQVAIDDLPPLTPDLVDGPASDAAHRFRTEIALADGFLLLAPVDDAAAQEVLIRALHWAATPAGEDALTDLPVVWLGVGGDPLAADEKRLQVEAAVEAGGGVIPQDHAALTAPIAGDWAGRIGPTGRLEDVPTRQAIGQVLIRLRQVALTGGHDRPGAGDGTDG